ncbi:hypothetical protein [Streptomyces sp. NRRL S-1813]|uniref:hypothetical protein n=1 Tax=Streptomyces sp. NRRL S-1813 TaxID=1463888 RepID=UPI000B10D972|nr:hypothetical protein [Streptomyces sp. NRRL S-1813]
MAGVAEQGGALGTQGGQADGDRPVAVDAAPEGGGEQPLAQRRVVERGELGLAGEVLQTEHELAFVSQRPGVRGGGRDLVLGQAGQLLGTLQYERRGRGGRPKVLPELGAQGGDLGIQLAQAPLLLRAEPRTGPDPVGVVALQQLQLLRVQPELPAPLEERVQPGEQGGVEQQRVVMGGQQRSDLDLERLDLLVGVRRGLVVEHPAHPAENRAAALQRLHGVLESRRLGAGTDRRHLCQLVGHSTGEGGGKVIVPDPRERRQFVGQITRLEEGVGRRHSHKGRHYARGRCPVPQSPHHAGVRGQLAPGMRGGGPGHERVTSLRLPLPRTRRMTSDPAPPRQGLPGRSPVSVVRPFVVSSKRGKQ